jgi:hypothetical protein
MYLFRPFFVFSYFSYFMFSFLRSIFNDVVIATSYGYVNTLQLILSS